MKAQRGSTKAQRRTMAIEPFPPGMHEQAKSGSSKAGGKRSIASILPSPFGSCLLGERVVVLSIHCYSISGPALSAKEMSVTSFYEKDLPGSQTKGTSIPRQAVCHLLQR